MNVIPVTVGAPGRAGDASRRASLLAAAFLCLLMVLKVAYAAATGPVTQLPFVVALFVLPLLCAFRGPRAVLAHYRWPVLAVQGVLTWAPFAIFGGSWLVGIGGLLAGMVLLMAAGPVSWLAAGALLIADVVVRITLVGLPSGGPAWYEIVWVILVFVDDALAFFGMVRLAQLVGQLQQARNQAGGLAVAAERLKAAQDLQSAVGQGLAAVAAMTAAARHALPQDPGGARAQMNAAGTAAREAAERARAVTAGRRGPASPLPLTGGTAVIGARLARAVLVVELCAYAVQSFDNVILDHNGVRLTTLVAIGLAVSVAAQLYHSLAARSWTRPRMWPLTLGLQGVLAYAVFLPPIREFSDLTPFFAGSVLLLVPGWRRWAGYAAVVISWSALFALVPLHSVPASSKSAFWILYEAGTIAAVGLQVYGLSRLTGIVGELETLRRQLERIAAVRERLRVARDVHDLLGLNLSALALKSDLIGKLIGRDDARAAAELEEMSGVCAAARADITLVTGEGWQLSLATEVAAAREVLASAGVQVQSSLPAGELPAAAGDVLAPVLREAVTNILRHSAAASCVIEVTTADSTVRLAISNDGVGSQLGPAISRHGQSAGGGSGLANLAARAQAAGGRLASRRADGRFELIAEIPVGGGADEVAEHAVDGRSDPGADSQTVRAVP
jgi:two-component system, NarL family, sensor histidine kinase DesK